MRALSRYHLEHPYEVEVNGHVSRVDYEPAESTTGVFGGNSNWRGPIWFPVNYLLIESLQKYHHYYGEDFKIEFPTHSKNDMDLWQIAAEISKRLTRIFLRDKEGKRPFAGGEDIFNEDPYWRDYTLFYGIFTAIMRPAWGPATKRGGPAWSPNFWNKAENSSCLSLRKFNLAGKCAGIWTQRKLANGW